METREKNTKERILEEALKLFSQSGYMGTSMNDIAAELGVTKQAGDIRKYCRTNESDGCRKSKKI